VPVANTRVITASKLITLIFLIFIVASPLLVGLEVKRPPDTALFLGRNPIRIHLTSAHDAVPRAPHRIVSHADRNQSLQWRGLAKTAPHMQLLEVSSVLGFGRQEENCHFRL
jgi:hypothetical protein